MPKQAPEVIAEFLGWDIAEVREGRYQPTRFSNPSIYVCGEDYFAAPTNGKAPNRPELPWTEAGESSGRKIFRAKNEDLARGPHKFETSLTSARICKHCSRQKFNEHIHPPHLQNF